MKLDHATAKREEQLEQIKCTASALAERKKSTSTLAAGSAHDEMPLPTHMAHPNIMGANVPHTTMPTQPMMKK